MVKAYQIRRMPTWAGCVMLSSKTNLCKGKNVCYIRYGVWCQPHCLSRASDKKC